MLALAASLLGCAKDQKPETSTIEKNKLQKIKAISQPSDTEDDKVVRMKESAEEILNPVLETNSDRKVWSKMQTSVANPLLYKHDPRLTIDLPESYNPQNPELEKYWIFVHDDKRLPEQRRILMSILGIQGDQDWQLDDRIESGEYLEHDGYKAKVHIVQIPKSIREIAEKKGDEIFRGCLFMTKEQLAPYFKTFDWDDKIAVKPFVPPMP